ncbi:MAG: hypothetical protein WDN30_07665 [Pararobbsia sp.]
MTNTGDLEFVRPLDGAIKHHEAQLQLPAGIGDPRTSGFCAPILAVACLIVAYEIEHIQFAFARQLIDKLPA